MSSSNTTQTPWTEQQKHDEHDGQDHEQNKPIMALPAPGDVPSDAQQLEVNGKDLKLDLLGPIDFLDHTYATMFQNEITKKRKTEAAMAVEAPKGLFGIASAVAGATDDDEEQERVVPGWESWEF